MRRGKLRITLAYKVYFIVLTSIACCALFIGAFSYYQSRMMLSENIGSSLKNILQTAALSIDTDKLKEALSWESDEYVAIRQYLLKVQKQNNIPAPIYIVKRSGKDSAKLLVTTEEGAPVGAEYSLNPTLRRVLTTGKSEFSPIYSDKSGTWISAFAPIYDRKGYMSGVLDLDYHVGYYIEQLRYRLLKIIMLCVLGFVIGTFLGIPLLSPILNSIKILTVAASEIEQGSFDHEITLRSSDELGYLAQAFEKMRKAIKSYTEQLKESWLKEKQAHLESVKALSEAIAVRESYTKGHIERVSKYAEMIARELGLSTDEIETIRYGCIIHDIGKIGVDINIINKTSELTSSEYDNIKKHPDMGAKIIKGVKFLEKAKDIILHHHERYDGKGYPNRLKGEEIPILARIVALADVYDAMASDRPYRERSESPEIVSKLKKESGKQFDPKVVDAFLRIEDKIVKENIRRNSRSPKK